MAELCSEQILERPQASPLTIALPGKSSGAGSSIAFQMHSHWHVLLGSYIVNRVTDKITAIADNVYLLRSGSASDTQVKRTCQTCTL